MPSLVYNAGRNQMNGPIRRLVAGFKSFRSQYYEQRPELIRSLGTEGQRPEILMIGCSDSRVDPALLMNAEPGEIFVVRNVANLVPPYEPDGRNHGTSAAMQFAVEDLGVSDIIVLGHSGCGGIQAMVEQAAGISPSREFITPWVSLAQQHCAAIIGDNPGKGCDLAACEKASIKGSLANLETFPFVRDRVLAKTLRIHGWWFELKKGQLWGANAGSDGYRRIV
jgi:carbonic anhydrase